MANNRRNNGRPGTKRRNTAHLVSEVKRIRNDVAKARDELRVVHADLARDIEVADTAVADLDRAIVTLEKYV